MTQAQSRSTSGVTALLRRLKLRHKLLFALLIVALAFVAVLGLLLISGRRTDQLLQRVEEGEVPALNLRRDLEAILVEYQRSLQDAAATEDLEGLEVADEHRDAFLATLENGRTNRALDPRMLGNLAAEFAGYSGLARETTAGLITGQADEDLIADLGAMTSAYNGIKKELADATVKQSEDLRQAFAEARRRQRALVATGAVLLTAALLVLSGLVLLLVRYLHRSLDQAVRAAEALAQGDVETRIVVETQDEIGTLLASMSRMTSYLREMAGAADAMAAGNFTVEVTPRSERDVFGNAFQKMGANLGRMIGQMAHASEQVLSSAGRISSSAREIAEGAEEQSVATEESSSTMQEIAAQIDGVSKSMVSLAGTVEDTSVSMEEIAASIDSGARNADDFLSSVEETAATIEEMAVSIRAIAEKVGLADRVSQEGASVVEEEGAELSRLMQAIGSSSQDIGKIVEINRSIATKTRLLAINAAIEAAHAGDTAKGIGVVAAEVKNLSEQAAESTREIAGYVETVQATTGNALQVTEALLGRILSSVTKSSDLVRDVMLATQEHDQGASEILGTSAHMRDTTRQMAEAAREQASGARRILQAVVEMAQMTQRVAQTSEEQKRGGDLVVESVDQIASIAREHLQAAEALSTATVELAHEARELQEMSELFQLSSTAEPG